MYVESPVGFAQTDLLVALSSAALALRGAAFTRGRPGPRALAPAAAAVALRHPAAASPLAATAAAAGLPYTALVSSPTAAASQTAAALKYAPTIHNTEYNGVSVVILYSLKRYPILIVVL